MQLLKFTIAAGETKRFEIAGRYIEIIEADAAISLQFFDGGGGQVDDAIGAVSGLYIESAFKALTVYSAAAQSLNLLITDGRGGSRRQPGNVRVINRVAAVCQQMVNANLATVDQVVQIVAPGSNVAGLIVRSVAVTAQPSVAGSASIQVFAAPSAPASGSAAEASVSPFVLISRAVSGDPAALGQRLDVGSQLEIPAGWGLYVSRINTVAATSSTARLSYEISVL